MKADAPSYHGYRFPPEIISHAVRLYHRFCVSFRDVEELLAQRGITVSYEAVQLWSIKFGPDMLMTAHSSFHWRSKPRRVYPKRSG